MAYLNCPFCPSQAFPTSVNLGMGLVRLRCIAFKHESYVRIADIVGEYCHMLEGKPTEKAEDTE